MTNFVSEATIEQVVLDTFVNLGYGCTFGPDLAPDGPNPERGGYGDVVLTGRLQEALCRLNPAIPDDAIEEAVRKLTRSESPNLVENNRRFHRMLTDGVPVEYHGTDGYNGAGFLDS